MNWMDKLERKDWKICSPESDVVYYHHVWSRICALHDKSGICTVSLPECTGNSAPDRSGESLHLSFSLRHTI